MRRTALLSLFESHTDPKPVASQPGPAGTRILYAMGSADTGCCRDARADVAELGATVGGAIPRARAPKKIQAAIAMAHQYREVASTDGLCHREVERPA
jgi:hypothetical protein